MPVTQIQVVLWTECQVESIREDQPETSRWIHSLSIYLVIHRKTFLPQRCFVWPKSAGSCARSCTWATGTRSNSMCLCENSALHRNKYSECPEAQARIGRCQIGCHINSSYRKGVYASRVISQDLPFAALGCGRLVASAGSPYRTTFTQ